MADLNLKAGTNMSIRQEDTDLYLDNTYEYDDEQIQNELLRRSLISETGNKIELILNNTNYKMTAILKDKYGNVISTSNEIDLPIETLVSSLYYDPNTKEIVFVLKDGTTTRIPLLDLIGGLATEEDLQTLEDNVNETIQTFEDDINEDMETFKGDVEQELEKAQQDLEMYKMLENALPKVEGEGESITLDNTAQTPMHLNFKGQIQQDSTTGKNLLDTSLLPITSNGITISQNDNGDIVINGTPTYSDTHRTFTIGVPKIIEANTYTMSIANKRDGLGINVGGFGGSLNITMSDVVTSKTVSSTQAYEIKAQINIRYDAGTFNNYIFNPMLRLASITDDTYEPYTGGEPSPSPSYPQDIHIVSGDNTIEICNKNLCKLEYLKLLTNTNGTTTINANAYNVIVNTKNINSLAVNGDNTLLSDNVLRVGGYETEYPAVGVSGVRISKVAGTNYYDVSNYDYVLFAFLKKGEVTVEDIENSFQIEVGTTSTTHVAHQEYTKEINLPVENLFDPTTAILVQKGVNGSDGIISGENIKRLETDNLIYLEAGTYTIQNATCDNYWVWTYDENLVYQYRELMTTWYKGSSYTFTLTSNRYVRFLWSRSDNSDISLTENFNIQLEKGTKANSYTPYGTTPIEVGDEDEFFKNVEGTEYYDSTLLKDKWYLKKRIGKVVLDGSESWTYDSSRTRFYATIYSTATMVRGQGLCNYYRYGDSVNSGCFDINVDKRTIYMFTPDSSITTTSAFKTWLSTHNTDVYYVLATPENILLNDTLQETLDSFYSWQEQTNISQENNDLPFVIKASAIYDLSNLVTRVAVLESEG